MVIASISEDKSRTNWSVKKKFAIAQQSVSVRKTFARANDEEGRNKKGERRKAADSGQFLPIDSSTI
jgi:hypothetical protein